MFGLGKVKSPLQPLACLLSEQGYSLVTLGSGQKIHCCAHQHFDEANIDLMAKAIAQDVERYHLIGQPCQVILAPGLYQLLLMDALEVPEEEMAKALRWHLKGMIDYPLNDIAVDMFLVPPHGSGGMRKRVFVAVTPQSALMNKLALLENGLLCWTIRLNDGFIY